MSKVAITKVREEEKRLPLFEEIERRFEAVKRRAFELFEGRGREHGHHMEDWLQAEQEIMGWPAAELVETDGAYELEITLPGFESKEIEVTAMPDDLIVHAASESRKEKKEEGIVWTEYGANDVYRSFHIPRTIDVDHVVATLDKGILHVKAPVAQVARPKPIAVAAA